MDSHINHGDTWDIMPSFLEELFKNSLLHLTQTPISFFHKASLLMYIILITNFIVLISLLMTNNKKINIFTNITFGHKIY